MIRLSDLEVGTRFDWDELIVENDGKSMRTIRNETGIEYGKKYDLMTFMYTLTPQGEGADVDLDGHSEIFQGDENYKEYSEKLKKEGLWSEDIVE